MSRMNQSPHRRSARESKRVFRLALTGPAEEGFLPGLEATGLREVTGLRGITGPRGVTGLREGIGLREVIGLRAAPRRYWPVGKFDLTFCETQHVRWNPEVTEDAEESRPGEADRSRKIKHPAVHRTGCVSVSART
jgi:hypothetical protein